MKTLVGDLVGLVGEQQKSPQSPRCDGVLKKWKSALTKGASRVVQQGNCGGIISSSGDWSSESVFTFLKIIQPPGNISLQLMKDVEKVKRKILAVIPEKAKEGGV